jgi:ABC-type antimicrobial peptide transport system permease subunit
MRLWLIGTLLGLAICIGATRVIASQLHGVSPLDPATFAAAAVLLALVAFAASYVPARRAACVAPTEALRYE